MFGTLVNLTPVFGRQAYQQPAGAGLHESDYKIATPPHLYGPMNVSSWSTLPSASKQIRYVSTSSCPRPRDSHFRPARATLPRAGVKLSTGEPAFEQPN